MLKDPKNRLRSWRIPRLCVALCTDRHPGYLSATIRTLQLDWLICLRLSTHASRKRAISGVKRCGHTTENNSRNSGILWSNVGTESTSTVRALSLSEAQL